MYALSGGFYIIGFDSCFHTNLHVCICLSVACVSIDLLPRLSLSVDVSVCRLLCLATPRPSNLKTNNNSKPEALSLKP